MLQSWSTLAAAEAVLAVRSGEQGNCSRHCQPGAPRQKPARGEAVLLGTLPCACPV